MSDREGDDDMRKLNFSRTTALLRGSGIVLILLSVNAFVLSSPRFAVSPQSTNEKVIASTSAESVRFTSLGVLIQMRLEVIGTSGEVLFDSGFKSGNVIDWHLSDKDGRRLVDGHYLCVVTVTGSSGKTTRKQAIADLLDQSVGLKQSDSSLLSQAQTDVVGTASSDDVSVTIVEPKESPATVVLAHDDGTAHLVSSSGELSISSGNIFANKLMERIRLTAEGNVGIGVTNPRARLEVAGSIRSTEGIVFPDGSIQYSAASRTLGAKSLRPDKSSADSQNVQPQEVAATQNRIPKFTDGAGTLGDSVMFESVAGNIGVGTTAPVKKLHVSGGQIALDNSRFVYSRRTNNQFQEAFGIDSNNDIIFNRNSLVGGMDADAPKAPSSLIFGTGAGKFLDVRNSSNASIMRVDEATGRLGIGTVTPGSALDVVGGVNVSAYYLLDGFRVLSAPAQNTFGGRSAGFFTTGNNNSFFGYQSGILNQGGNDNSFFGSSAGRLNTVGSQNAFFGFEAGKANGNGSSNAFFGYQAGLVNTVGGNSFFGGLTGSKNTTGNLNSFFGNGAGADNSTGSGNTFMGNGAGSGIGIGNRNSNYNTAVGNASGEITEANGDSQSGAHHNTLIGAGAGAEDNDNDNGPLRYATAIGAGAVARTRNTIYLGRSHLGYTDETPSGGDDVVVGGQLFVWNLTGPIGGSRELCIPDSVFPNRGTQIHTCSSSLRYKNDAKTYSGGMDIVRRLRPITFQWRGGSKRDLGFGAEEVEKVEPLLVFYNEKGEVDGVKYRQITAVLVNAINEQQRTIEQQHRLVESCLR
jgi:hypothetical protein